MAERLQFGAGDMAYHAMSASEHLSRYSLLKEVCAGKRVLDVACGEGYGSYLLARWGAASVTAIDISEEAIEKAKKYFPSEKITYLVGDAHRVAEVVPSGAQFDLICSFETIEHLADPQSFVEQLSTLRAGGGAVVASVPNDAILPDGVSNPYHLQKFDFSAFKVLTEKALGPAAQWLFGTPIQGFTLLSGLDGSAPNPELDMRLLLDYTEAGSLLLLPAQQYLAPIVDNVQFWLGLWGGGLPPTSTAAPQSMKSWLEPWEALDNFKLQLKQKDIEIEQLKARQEDSGAELAEARMELTRLAEAERAVRAERDNNISEIRRLGTALAEERRAGETVRKRADELERLVASGARLDEHSLTRVAQEVAEVVRKSADELGRTAVSGTRIDEYSVLRVAQEVWMEKRRRRFRSKLRRWIKRYFVK